MGDGEWETLKAGECGVVPAGVAYAVKREAQSIGWQITQDPTGNNADNRARVDKEKAAETNDDKASKATSEATTKKQKTDEE